MLKEAASLRSISLLACLPLCLWSPAAGAESVTPLLVEFGNTRSVLWGILEERPRGAATAAFRLADQLALNPDRESLPYLVGTSLTFAPVLKYDRNVNNGFKNGTIHIGGLPFSVEEAEKAVTIGGAVSGGVSLGLAKGTTLTLGARSEYQRAIGKKFEVFDTTGFLSLDHTTQNWTYLNATYLVNEEKRALGTGNVKIASFTAGKLFGQGGSHLHDVSGTFSRVQDNSTWQSRARVDWTGSFAGHGVFRFGLERGETIDGVLLPRTTVTGSYANIMLGAPTTLSAYYSERVGGDFFGEIRNDDVYRVGITRKITDRVSLHGSYEYKDSTNDSFDESGIDIGFSVTGFSF